MSSRFSDPIFLGLTRPAMFLGVTQSFLVMNAMTCLMMFLAFNSFLPLLVLFPLLHGIGYLGCLYDPRIFDISFVFARFCLRCRNKSFWSMNSYEPF